MPRRSVTIPVRVVEPIVLQGDRVEPGRLVRLSAPVAMALAAAGTVELVPPRPGRSYRLDGADVLPVDPDALPDSTRLGALRFRLRWILGWLRSRW